MRMAEDLEYCGVCAKSGKKSVLKVYQINFEEAIRFCEDEKCTYPVGMDGSSWVLSRKFSELKVSNSLSTKKVNLQQLHYPRRSKPISSKSFETGKKGSNPSPKIGAISGQKGLVPCKLGKEAPVSVSCKTKNAIKNNIRSISTEGSLTSAKFLDTISHNHPQIIYPQWQNQEALCWLDVILCLLVHCKQVKKIRVNDHNSTITTLLKAYDQALVLLNRKSKSCSLTGIARPEGNSVLNGDKTSAGVNGVSACTSQKNKCSVNSESINVTIDKHNEEIKTGAGLQIMNSDIIPLTESHIDLKFSKAFTILNDVRENIWHQLHPRLLCKKGKNDSPVFAIPLLAKNNKDMESMLCMKYSFHLHCTKCGYKQIASHEKVLPTFPNTVVDFSPDNLAFVRPCFKCDAGGQLMKMELERLPPVMMLHFQVGLPHNNFSRYDFKHMGKLYQATGVIQYRNDPDHFIAWIRNPKEELWMECNDLKSPVCHFGKKSPSFPANQVHIVMWEAVDHNQDIGQDLGQNFQTSTAEDCQELLQEPVVSFSSEGQQSSLKVKNNFFGNESVNQMNNSDTGSTVTDAVLKSSPSLVQCMTPATYCNSYVSGSSVMSSCNKSLMKNRNDASRNGDLVSSEKNVQGPLPVTCNTFQSVSPPFSKSASRGALSTGTISVDIKQSAVVKSCPVKNRQSLQHSGPVNGHQSLAVSKATIELRKSQKMSEYTNKGNISLLRMLKNPGLSSGSLPKSKEMDRKLNNSQVRRSVEILSTILNRKTESAAVPLSLKGKVFEGYKSKSSMCAASTSLLASGLKGQSSDMTLESDTDAESIASRPGSPALSCHSDSVVVQKRKMDLSSDEKSVPALKRRKSEDFSLERLLPYAKSHSLGTLAKLVSVADKSSENISLVKTKKYVLKRSAVGKPIAVENGAITNGKSCDNFKPTTIGNGCNKVELSIPTNRSDRDCQESDILQNLYSALNVSLPTSLMDEKSSVKPVDGGTEPMDVENIPDISELDKFINSDCDSNIADNFDDFLSQL